MLLEYSIAAFEHALPSLNRAFVYLSICRVLELAVLLARSDDANEIELLALRSKWPC